MKPPFQDLSQLLGALAYAPAQAQRILDVGWAESKARWLEQAATVLAGIPEPKRPDLAALVATCAPARQIVSDYEIECGINLRVDNEKRFAIRARPLNLGFERIYSSKNSSACRVTLQIKAVPLPAMPSVVAGLPIGTDEQIQTLQPTN